MSLVISFPQWQMNVLVAMRLPTMKSGMPTIAPTTVQQSKQADYLKANAPCGGLARILRPRRKGSWR